MVTVTVSELKKACEEVEKEHGSDARVVIIAEDEEEGLNIQDYCYFVYQGIHGSLCLTNRKE